MKTVNYVESTWVAGGEKIARTFTLPFQIASEVQDMLGGISLKVGADVEITATRTESNGDITKVDFFSTHLDTIGSATEMQEAVAGMLAQDSVHTLLVNLYL